MRDQDSSSYDHATVDGGDSGALPLTQTSCRVDRVDNYDAYSRLFDVAVDDLISIGCQTENVACEKGDPSLLLGEGTDASLQTDGASEMVSDGTQTDACEKSTQAGFKHEICTAPDQDIDAQVSDSDLASAEPKLTKRMRWIDLVSEASSDAVGITVESSCDAARCNDSVHSYDDADKDAFIGSTGSNSKQIKKMKKRKKHSKMIRSKRELPRSRKPLELMATTASLLFRLRSPESQPWPGASLTLSTPVLPFVLSLTTMATLRL